MNVIMQLDCWQIWPPVVIWRSNWDYAKKRSIASRIFVGPFVIVIDQKYPPA